MGSFVAGGRSRRPPTADGELALLWPSVSHSCCGNWPRASAMPCAAWPRRERRAGRLAESVRRGRRDRRPGAVALSSPAAGRAALAPSFGACRRRMPGDPGADRRGFRPAAGRAALGIDSYVLSRFAWMYRRRRRAGPRIAALLRSDCPARPARGRVCPCPGPARDGGGAWRRSG